MPQTQKPINELPSAEIPSSIQNGFTAVDFVRAILERDKKDNPQVVFEISFALNDEHEKKHFCPRKVTKAWAAMDELDLKSAEIKAIPPQAVDLAIAPEMGDDKTTLALAAVAIEKMRLTEIVEKGTGKTKRYVRLSCRIRVGLSDSTMSFARKHFGGKVWLRWEQAQKEIFN